MPEQQVEHYFTKRQAAKLLSVEISDVNRAVEAGAVPADDQNRLKLIHVLAIGAARHALARGFTLDAAKQIGEIILAHSEAQLREKIAAGRKFLLGVSDEILPLMLNHDDIYRNEHMDLPQALSLGIIPLVIDVGSMFANLTVRALRVTRTKHRIRTEKFIRRLAAGQPQMRPAGR